MRRATFLVLLAVWTLPAGALGGEKPAVAPDLPAGLSAVRTRMRAASRPATPDLIAVVWRCPRCKRRNASRRLLPEQPPFDRLKDVERLLSKAGLGQGRGWAAPKAGPCWSCGLRPGAGFKPKPLEVIFFRYLSETGCHAVARAPAQKGRLGKLTWGKLDVSGAYDRVAPINDQAGFARAFGRVLSVREAWSDVARSCIAKNQPQVLRAAPGYFLTCRLRSADAETEARLATELNIKLAKAGGGRAGARRMPLTAVSGSALEKVIPTYRRWLPGQRRQLESGKYLAAAVVDPGEFWRMAARETARSGVQLDRPVTARDPEIVKGEYRVSLQAEGVLLKTVYAGLSFGEGLHHFFWPLAAKLVKVERVGRQARLALAAYETQVAAGNVLVIREKANKPLSGKELARVNLFALAGSVDPRFPRAVSRALGGLVGLDPASGRIRAPRADETRCACGQAAWLTKKLRPKGHFEKLGVKVLAAEWRGLTAVWSLDCREHARLLPARPAPDRKKIEARFEKDLEKTILTVLAARGLAGGGIQVRAAVGPDIASALIHPRLRRGLAVRLKAPQEGIELHFWAPTTNVVLVSQKPIAGRDRDEFRRGAKELIRAAGLAPGYDIELEMREKMTAKPAGVFTKN